MATLSKYATAYALGTGTVSNPSNAYNSLSDSTYATVMSGTVDFRGFDFSSLPSDAVVSSVKFSMKCQQLGDSITSQTDIYVNGINKGYITVYSADGVKTYSKTVSNISAAQLKASTTTTYFEVEGYSSSGEYFNVYGFEILVTYTLPTFTITASAGENGSISPSGTVNVTSGNDQTFTITPDTGYLLDTLTVDSSPASPTTTTPSITYVFSNVTTAHSISATFKLAYDLKSAFHAMQNQIYFGGL